MTRIRAGLEAAHELSLGRRLTLRPTAGIAVRQDGGDAETGTGVESSGGLTLTDTATGLTVDVRVRTLVAHQAASFRERGASIALGWNPTPASPLGLTARIAPAWGAETTGSAWETATDTELGVLGTYDEAGRLEADVGYGLPVGRRLVGTPHAGVSSSAFGRFYRLGYGLRPLEQGSGDLDVGVETRFGNSGSGRAGTAILGRARVRW